VPDTRAALGEVGIQMLTNLILACSIAPTRLSDLAINSGLGLAHATCQDVA
jgi:hypothetical protein